VATAPEAVVGLEQLAASKRFDVRIREKTKQVLEEP
jgi:hypothetical protein